MQQHAVHGRRARAVEQQLDRLDVGAALAAGGFASSVYVQCDHSVGVEHHVRSRRVGKNRLSGAPNAANASETSRADSAVGSSTTLWWIPPRRGGVRPDDARQPGKCRAVALRCQGFKVVTHGTSAVHTVLLTTQFDHYGC